MSCERLNYNMKMQELKIKESFNNRRLKDLERRIIKAIYFLNDTPKVVKSVHYKDKEEVYVFIENIVKQTLLNILEGNDFNENIKNIKFI